MELRHKSNALPRFASWSRAAEAKGTDLSTDVEAQKVVTELLKRLFNPDFSLLKITGNLYDASSMLRICLLKDGEPYRQVDVEIPAYSGIVVCELEGEPTKALRRDIEGMICRQWLPALGMSPDTPCHFEMSLRKCGKLDLTLIPAF